MSRTHDALCFLVGLAILACLPLAALADCLDACKVRLSGRGA